MTETKPRDPFRDIRLSAGAGLALLVLLAATVGVWAATAPLSGAVIAAGQVVVESNVRRIQHPTGGIVGAIHVNDGDRVKAGDDVMDAGGRRRWNVLPPPEKPSSGPPRSWRHRMA